jgi:adenine-specific DNA-methyltransferase
MSELKFSELSQSLTKKINIRDKKNDGIYFTPPETVAKNIKLLEPFIKNMKTVLEPACGSCEYILQLKDAYSNMNITGIELNETIYESIKVLNKENITLINDNYLSCEITTKYDLIIGNPPYFVMKKDVVDNSYYNYFDGRPNIFILFIIKSLKLLNDGGILSFVLPKNFSNCLYYDKTRKHIIQNYTILNIIECTDDKYIDTKQDTIILVLQNEKPKNNNNSKYNINISGYNIFGTPDNISKLTELYTDSKTLYDLGFNVSVGNIVWNQHKKDLTDDSNKTLLIYSSDITNNKLTIKQYTNKEKKNYINKTGTDEALLIINRGYGVGCYNFNYCIINENDNIKYLIENHLICIKYTKSLSKKELVIKYKKIMESFNHYKTIEFIKIYFGNNAINTTELSKILPIYNI